MKKGTKVVVVLLVLVLIAGIYFFLQSRKEVFVGSCDKGVSSYVLDFEKMNGTDSHVIKKQAREDFIVEFYITKGKADILIASEVGNVVYRGNNLTKGGFKVELPETDSYVITITAKNAKGSISIK